MKKLLLTSWIADTLIARLPFLERKAPWYRRYRVTRSPWVPAAMVAPLALFLLIEWARRFLPAPPAARGEDDNVR